MIALTLNISTFGLISAAVIWVAYSLWENHHADKRRAERYRKAWRDASEEAHQARLQLIRYESIVSAAEEWRDSPEGSRDDELIEAVDWRRTEVLPPPTGEPIT